MGQYFCKSCLEDASLIDEHIFDDLQYQEDGFIKSDDKQFMVRYDRLYHAFNESVLNVTFNNIVDLKKDFDDIFFNKRKGRTNAIGYNLFMSNYGKMIQTKVENQQFGCETKSILRHYHLFKKLSQKIKYAKL